MEAWRPVSGPVHLSRDAKMERAISVVAHLCVGLRVRPRHFGLKIRRFPTRDAV